MKQLIWIWLHPQKWIILWERVIMKEYAMLECSQKGKGQLAYLKVVIQFHKLPLENLPHWWIREVLLSQMDRNHPMTPKKYKIPGVHFYPYWSATEQFKREVRLIMRSYKDRTQQNKNFVAFAVVLCYNCARRYSEVVSGLYFRTLILARSMIYCFLFDSTQRVHLLR